MPPCFKMTSSYYISFANNLRRIKKLDYPKMKQLRNKRIEYINNTFQAHVSKG